MAPLIVGILLLVLANALVLPYVLWLLFTIAGVLLVIYGLVILFGGFRGEPTTRYHRRYWY